MLVSGRVTVSHMLEFMNLSCGFSYLGSFRSVQKAPEILKEC